MYLYVFPMYILSSSPFVSLMKVMKAVKKKVQLIMKNVYQMVREKYTFVFQGMETVKEPIPLQVLNELPLYQPECIQIFCSTLSCPMMP